MFNNKHSNNIAQEKVREFFDCATLEGAELENQDTSEKETTK